MDNLTQEIIDRLADEASDLYLNDDEGKYEFNEIIEQFKDSVKTELEKNSNKTCIVIEYDEDYDVAIQTVDNMLEDIQGCKICEYYTAEVSDVHFWFILTEKN